MNSLICQFGGRKYFYCTLWLAVATGLRVFDKIGAVELVGLYAWFFTNVVAANSHEAVAEINSKSAQSD